MLESKIIIGGIAFFLFLLGYILYVKDIFRGRTKPHAFSWLIWSVLGGIVFFAQITNNAGPGSWVIGLSMSASFFVFILSLRMGERNITLSDTVSLAGAGFALFLWYLTNNALISVILATVIELFGFYPTVRKSLYKPEQETAMMYALTGFNLGLSLLALENYSLVTYLYPASLVLMNFSFVALLLIKRNNIKL